MRALLTAALLFSFSALAANDVAPPPPPPPQPAPAAPAGSREEYRWPGAHAFGIRAGLGGSTGTPGINVGNVGIKFLLTDNLALSADFGLGLSTGGGVYGGGASASFALDGLLAIYLRDAGQALRPYVPLLFGLGFSQVSQPIYNSAGQVIGQGTSTGSFSLAAGAGIGAEYFLARNFSLAADLMIVLHIASVAPVGISIGTVTPGVHATYYF